MSLPVGPLRAAGLLLAAAAAAVASTGCRSAPSPAADEEPAVREVLDRQVREWNSGSLDGFMETYARSQGIRFASGGDVSLGWETVLERYRKKYGGREAMGKLTFTDIDIAVLSADAAVAFGRWRLEREGDRPSGLFTLLLRKTPEGWRIVHDHTSSAAAP